MDQRACNWARRVRCELSREDWPLYVLSWTEHLVVKSNEITQDSSIDHELYTEFWQGFTHPHRLHALLQLLPNPSANYSLRWMTDDWTKQHPNSFSSGRHRAMRWQLAIVYAYLRQVRRVNTDSYSLVQTQLRPTQYQIDDFYRYLLWKEYLADQLHLLDGFEQIIGATPLTAQQLLHHLKVWQRD